MNKNPTIFEKTIFKNSPLSTREAFLWLAENSENCQIHISLRSLAAIWKWHYSAVKRFLDKLKVEFLIEISISSKIMRIKIADQLSIKAITETILEQKRSNEKLSYTEFESIVSTISQQSVQQASKQSNDNPVNKNSFCNNVNHSHNGLEENTQTIFAQQTGSNSEQEEEKKKRSKKRKEEEFIKERNIPYGDTKKENLNEDSEFLWSSETLAYFTGNVTAEPASDFVRKAANTQLCKKNQIPVHLVETKDVEVWAKETLPFELDLAWELGKFQDYWNIAEKKPPKNGVAALRNWLRKAVEIKTNKQGEKNDRSNNYRRQEKTSDFERFLIGGAGALDELRRDRLDRNGHWQE